MDTLQSMKVFVRVAHRSGFAAAGRDLRMSPAAVTKHIAALEARVDARLFDRTTRSVGLTEVGRMYLERCLECLQAFEDADAFVGTLGHSPAGLLRVTAPVDLQNHLPTVVGRFMNEYPKVTVDLELSNRAIDLVEEGFDVAIRGASSLDGRFVARQLAHTQIVICAAPSYLRRHGYPRKPEHLERHRGIVFVEPRPRTEWVLERNGKQTRIKLNSTVLTNNGGALCAMMVEGVGLGAAPSYLVRADLDAGRIEPVLLDWKVLPEVRLYAVYPHRRFLAPKVRAFVETLRATYGDGTKDPWWPETTAVSLTKRERTKRAATAKESNG